MKGLTFIELILVISILSILTAISTPMFRHTFDNLQVRNFCRDISKLSKYAQERAIMEQVLHRIDFDVNNKEYWVSTAKDPLNPEKLTGLNNKFGRMRRFPPNIVLECAKPYAVFYPDGTADELTMYISGADGEVYTLTNKETTGYVKVFKIGVSPKIL
ncbi:prepilin-type N-terminal cleavage/methylation domain-containing protein, partial [bacterium]|nr:prepilin-type N-terminal cleavage/methylation domain-containing protein [bacterium]